MIKYAVCFVCVFLLLQATSAFAQKQGNKNVIYKYKKYERFDFEDLVIEGDTGSPGDLSVTTRFQKKYKNRLPYRKNFNPEIRKAVDRIR